MTRHFFGILNSLLITVSMCICCNPVEKRYTTQDINNELDLKRGDIIICGPTEMDYSQIQFQTSCDQKVIADFNTAIAMLHSFEYEEAEKIFAKVIDADPKCAMAYWGVAMANYHPLWETPSPKDLEKGSRVIERARELGKKSTVEDDYIAAIGEFYADWAETDHRTRSGNYARAMRKIYARYPQSREAAVFYALALLATADPSDKTYANQRQAGSILTSRYPGEPDHPGVVHYLIHAYDYPELATEALPAARKYASIAPYSAHAQHMPSHIFTRLGLWDESINANLASTNSARCYGESAGINGHWDEELHGMDYLVYGYLQSGQNAKAREQWNYLSTIGEIYPVSFKGAYAFAAIPSRYCLENKLWSDASNLQLHPVEFPWEKFPWQRSVFHFARLMGMLHSGQLASAQSELESLERLHELLVSQSDLYKAEQIMVQIETGKAWLSFKEGDGTRAIELMISAAEREERIEKHPVTPGAVIPARELLGDLFLEMGRAREALAAYEADLRIQPNRFNGVYGAAQACEQLNDRDRASQFYRQLLSFAGTTTSDRKELTHAKAYLDSVVSPNRE